ncbi:MAG: hypothetical protein HN392_11315 [Anaerolineae bacterium]|jgi:predicted site-specific integrase-resolvase|nr:hypothetical protein [Anaerolineae bacterium]MBT7783570.1 hypothetical protein [Anaerolineae bacterium]
MSITLKSLPSYISLNEAGKRLDLNDERLQDLIRAGTLKAIRMKGETIVDEEKVEEIAIQPKKEELEEYKQFSHLAGEKIWATEAARKYQISRSTISRWARLDYIARLDSDGYRVYLDEQDVAYCVSVYEERKGQGKRVFNKDGTPYQTKTNLEPAGKEKEG